MVEAEAPSLESNSISRSAGKGHLSDIGRSHGLLTVLLSLATSS